METAITLTTDLTEQAKKVFESLDVSESTRKVYQSNIPYFMSFTDTEGLHHNTFLHYKQFLASQTDISISTKDSRLNAARILLKELNRQGHLPVDITQNVKSFKRNKAHKREGLSNNDMTILSKALKQLSSTPSNTRIKAIISLLALQGLRQIEITRLEVSDINFIDNTLLVRGKGQDDKEAVDLHPETVKNLKEYLSSNEIADGYLFISDSNNSKGSPLTTRSVRRMVKDLFEELKIDRFVHGFRHWFTTELIKSYKGDVLMVQQYTRHKSLEMLQVYNDNVKKKSDLPKYYETFQVSF